MDSPPGLTLRTPEGRPYLFDPGALCLELLPTGGPGLLARYEVLHEPADLVRWAERSRLPAGLAPAVSASELVDAHTLRDALHRLATDRAHGRALGASDLDVVNRFAAREPLVARIDVGAGVGAVRAWAPGATGSQLLSTVARDAIDLFTGPYARRIRACGSHDCSLLFVDTSRPGRRRWCAMERCGNRSKARAHRARQSENQAGTRAEDPAGQHAGSEGES
ncbi:zf-CGNR multi-domain protein [Streptomyces agglomeratus]|uniref:Zf-CGNR multi-domain protein n=1 Tax=Streptomyces agglomeratus TaxID=285458 RepID=A0A1E5P7S5_9ACTN|nr:ABATE domain-containing protein [Streptomyces agglomeratus]OEJ25601.1 zf-CGNR multi-domain protein [Streptomyces agglomeratus]OEJ40361.1 zf-CGNR multi-domain protein [Streptomyces agglomeratus]OEJ45261.1 zf-CGNR multi-domain protein [Streptomyces agglomeratus]OEJ52912.1 zf-CGNR multi-domain protein [Streptomyces agglomeratus]OEJ60249.1 zf-CGNR multi-domain protein [Streptomyces agglomeratus]